MICAIIGVRLICHGDVAINMSQAPNIIARINQNIPAINTTASTFSIISLPPINPRTNVRPAPIDPLISPPKTADLNFLFRRDGFFILSLLVSVVCGSAASASIGISSLF